MTCRNFLPLLSSSGHDLLMDVAQLRRGNLFLAAFLTVITCANWHGHDL
ncbi:hypothetical protein T4A_3915 [Trichinella pseudospiralis]|uniref:Uncharacterized protein n=1 Tax=Trichinella pseudospiralis TaxID=6337 RepID=A0A0V1DS18_TRIPS|nr:hypothetical protein T4A_13277 [Trichinella pseudospiralis]KRY65141.1 hypothetical protein T4A_6082 [Trichinella pseudospiralis]KRY69006.1 hypothetical protein T4A_3915 [Trichinella pseudospiralis]